MRGFWIRFSKDIDNRRSELNFSNIHQLILFLPPLPLIRMVFTARIRRSVVMPIDEPVAGCSPSKWHWSQERFHTQDLDDVASDYSKATQGPF